MLWDERIISRFPIRWPCNPTTEKPPCLAASSVMSLDLAPLFAQGNSFGLHVCTRDLLL